MARGLNGCRMAISVNTPEAAVAATPYLLGFPPRDSLVLLLLDEDDQLLVSMRVDLPPEPQVDWLMALLRGIVDPAPASAVVLTYADTVGAAYAQAVGMWVMHVLLPISDVVDVILVAEGHYASLSMGHTELDEGCELADIAAHPVAAACVAAGLTQAASREELIEMLAPVDDEVTGHVRSLLRETRRGRQPARTREALEERALAILRSSQDLEPADIAAVARACRDVHVRDPLLTQLLEDSMHESGVRVSHVRTRLVYCLIHTPGRLGGSVAATLALLSWADGDGAAALVAADRAVASDPANSLAPLIVQALQHGLPPDTWSTLTDDIPLDVLRGIRRRSA